MLGVFAQKLSLRIKLHVFDTTLYKSETWKITNLAATIKKNNVLQQRCLQQILTIQRDNHIHNHEVLQRSNMEPSVYSQLR